MKEKKEPKTEDLLKNYPTLKKFDELYKDEKNIKKYNILYKKPNVDQEKCQIDFNEFDKKYNLNNYSEKKEKPNNIKINSNVTKKYDFSKLSKDDLNYYLTLVKYYHEKIYGGNIFVKGVNGPIEKALELLKQCQYNIRLALAKILFPVLDKMGGLAEFQNPSLIIPQAMDTRKNENEKNKMEIKEKKENKDYKKENEKKNSKIGNDLLNEQKKLLKTSPSIYLSFALNDLIGADKALKEKWLQYIIDQVNNKVDYKYLKTLIEMSNKMKLDLPENIIKEINLSEMLSNEIKKHLEEKDQNLNELKDLYDIAKTQKVQTEEFNNLKEIIEQGEIWVKKSKDIIGNCVEYEELESLYNEANNLPFEIDPDLFKSLSERYEKAKQWLDLYSKLPKYPKNKSNNKLKFDGKSENSLSVLQKLINLANVVLKFTSPEVKLLIKNYVYLNETETEIKNILNDNTKKITKDMLKNFLNKLNESKFTTELHDEIEDKLNIMEWRDNLFENINPNDKDNNAENLNNENYLNIIISKKNKIVLKNKTFKFLIKEAELKKLLNYQDVKYFVNNDEMVSLWIQKIEPIFDENKEREKMSAKNIYLDLHNSSNSINFVDFLNLFEEGQKFSLINEECEELLKKSIEIKELYDEVKQSFNEEQNILNFNKLKYFGDRIAQYNIICDVFDIVLKQLNLGQEWLENSKKFCLEYNNECNNKFNLYYIQKDINNNDDINIEDYIKIRNENIRIIEKYIKEKKIFFEDLLKLTQNVPLYLKNTSESIALTNHQHLGELTMNSISKFNSPEEILLSIEESQGMCISKDIIVNCFNLYKIKTWNRAIKYKLYLSHAEALLNEAESLQKIEINEDITEKINISDIEELNNKIKVTNDWINKTKVYLCKKDKTFKELILRAKESQELPLLSKAIDELIEFKNLIENNINEIKKIKNEKKDLKIIVNLYKNFNNNKFIDSDEYKYIKSLYDLGIKWTDNAKKIINSRQLCQLYFKNKVPLEDGTIIETKENLVDILSNPQIVGNNNINNNILIEPNITNIMNDNLLKSHKFIMGENQFNDNNNLNNFLSKKRNSENSINDNDKDNKEKDIKNNKEIKKINDKNNNIKEINLNNNSINIDENINEKNNNYIKNNNILNSSTLENQQENEYHQSESVKKYYLNQPLQKYECSNLLSLINNKESLSLPLIPKNDTTLKQNYFTRSHGVLSNPKKSDTLNTSNNPININNSKMDLQDEQKVTEEQIQNFISMDYYHRYMYLRSHLIFHDDTNEQYCICRKGDDSVNYMIICEKCKEWFHGKCLDMPKSVADSISNYYCLCCSRKFDLPKESYHKQFFEIKRVSLNELVIMIEEGKKANCYFEEIEVLEDIKIRSELWNKKFYKLLDEITEFFKKNKFLNEDYEKKLEILYLESESIQIELSNFLHPITILKHNEWFKSVDKEIKSIKQDEENIKNLIISCYWIFNIYEKNIVIPKLEKPYYETIIQLAELKLEVLLDIYKILRQNNNEDNSSNIKEKNKRK